MDQLRAVLDGLGARRRIMHVDPDLVGADEIAQAAGLGFQDAVQPVLLEADRDFVAALVPGRARLSNGRVAELIGARRVRLLGPQQTRRWLARWMGHVADPADTALTWWEVPFLTGLPTIASREILLRNLVIVPTGTPGWIVRLQPGELTRITNAHLGAITPADEHPARKP